MPIIIIPVLQHPVESTTCTAPSLGHDTGLRLDFGLRFRQLSKYLDLEQSSLAWTARFFPPWPTEALTSPANYLVLLPQQVDLAAIPAAAQAEERPDVEMIDIHDDDNFTDVKMTVNFL
ncbi:hypothetical protein V8F20_003087 [Naviculisporaceae sp. PSN 640]